VIARLRDPLIVMLAALGAACGARDAQVAPPQIATVMLELRVTSLSGALPEGGTVTATSAGGTSTIALSSAGTARVPALAGDSLRVRIDASAASPTYASEGRLVVHRDTSVDVVLIPRRWVVQHGEYAGMERPIDLPAAIGLNPDGSHFLDVFAPTPAHFLGWPASAFPIPVGFDSTTATRRWTASDSLVFWQYADEMSRIAGETLFRRVGDQSLTSPGAIGLQADYTFKTPPEAWLFIRSLGSCQLPVRFCDDLHGVVAGLPGLVYRYSPTDKLVMHELMHALGFGHSCHWPSIMALSLPGCDDSFPSRPSVEDIAYIEFVTQLATVLAEHPDAWQLEEALAAIH
jgi:hypothetical protein